MKEKELAQITTNKTQDVQVEIENILKKIEINDDYFYYEPKENGRIYDKYSVHVGFYKDNEFCFDI
jgi:hypothetical protein